jgi:hypothetical protein
MRAAVSRRKLVETLNEGHSAIRSGSITGEEAWSWWHSR